MRSLILMATFVAFSSNLDAQSARLSVVHGIPGLAGPVEVRGNGSSLFSFDYTDIRGPLSVDAGTINVELWVGGALALQGSLMLDAGREFSAVAHLDAAGQPKITLFDDDMAPIASGQARVTVRHTAQAPTVDVGVDQSGARVLTIPNLSNAMEAAADVPTGAYDASLFLATTTNLAFGPVGLSLSEDISYRVYAIGDVSAPSFTIIVQTVDFSPAGEHARISILHGIPGLPAPVDVVADGATLFSFDYTDIRGPLQVPTGPTRVEVQIGGSTVLSTDVVLEDDAEYSAIAHLDVNGQATISLFQEDLTPIAAGEARVTVRHTAQAGAVDVGVDQIGTRILTIPGLTNPNGAAVDVPVGTYDATIFGAGTTNIVFGPAALTLQEDISYQVYAVGDATSPNFTVLVQAIDFSPAYAFSSYGTACGGTIFPSTAMPMVSTPFDVGLSGATSSAPAVLLVGFSETEIAGAPLPIDLTFVGAVGCSLYTDARFSASAATDAGGSASFTLQFSTDTARFLEGAYFQWAFMSPSNPFGMQFTEGLALTR